MKRSLALCLFVILSATATASLAATRTFTGPGNFSSVSNWDGGTTLPAAGDDLLIDGVCTFDDAAPSLQYASVTLNSGATLNWPVGGTNTLTLNSIVGNASTLDMTNGGKLVLLGTGTPFGPNIAFTGGTGEVRYQGSGALSIALATYNDLTINGGGTASLSGATTVNNNLNIASGTLLAGANILTINNDAIVALGSSLDTGTVAHTIAGNLVLDGVLTGSGSVYLNGAGKSVSGGGSAGSGTFVRFNASHNILAGSNLTINGGMFLSVYVTVTNSGTVTAGSGISGTDATAVWLNSVNGTLDFPGAGISVATLDATTPGNLVQYMSASVQPVAPTTYSDLTLSGGGTKSINGITVNRNLTIRGSASVTLPSAMTIGGSVWVTDTATFDLAGYALTVNGGWTSTATVSCAGSTVTFAAPSGGPFTITNSATSTFDNVVFTNTPTLLLNTTFIANGNVTISTGATVDGQTANVSVGGNWTVMGNFIPSTSTVMFSGPSNTTIGASPFATLIIGGGSGNKTLGGNITAASLTLNSGSYFQASAYSVTLSGNFTNNAAPTGSFSAGTGTFVFAGTAAQSVNGGATTFSSVTVSNTSGLTLNTAVTVNGALTLGANKIYTNGQALTVGSGGAIGTAGGYIVGALTRQFPAGGAALSFDVGTATTYAAMSISIPAASAPATITVQTFDGAPASKSGTNILARYWSINETVGGTGDFTLWYAAAEVTGTEANYVVGRYNGTWTRFGAVNTGTHTGSATGVALTGNWTVGEPASLGANSVTNTADSGAGSLRDAITNANNGTCAAPCHITFAIGSGVQTIMPASQLPMITAANVTIDGTTQPGYSGAPLIVLDGSSAGGGSNGLYLSGGTTTVKGLAIVNFSANGISVNSTGNKLLGNYIGLAQNGTSATPNSGAGVVLFASGNSVGGTSAAEANFISGNFANGIVVVSSNNTIKGNYIGTGADGSTPVGNSGYGVYIENTANDNVIGIAGGSNVIAYNQKGVALMNGAEARNAIRFNSIHDNIAIGIDLNDDGPTADDTADVDGGANGTQNFPIIGSARFEGTSLQVHFSIDSSGAAATAGFLFDVYKADASGLPQGKTLLGSSVCVAGKTLTDYLLTIPSPAASVGDKVVMTATSFNDAACTTLSDGTSEFSPAVTVGLVKHWIGATGLWSNPNGWTPNGVPGANDTASIDGVGIYTVSLDVAQTIGSLFLGSASGTPTVDVGGTTLTINTASVIDTNGVLTFSGGFGGDGRLLLRGQMTAAGGSLYGNGALDIDIGGVLDVTGSVILDTRPIHNNGALYIDYAGTTLRGVNGPLVTNNGTFRINVDGTMLDTMSGAAVIIDNYASLAKAGSSGQSTLAWTLRNHTGALVNAKAGTFTLTGGGDSTASFAINDGAWLEFGGGTFVLDANAAISASTGGVLFTGGTFTLAGTYGVGATSVAGGVSAALNGPVTSLGDLWIGSGTLQVNSGGALNVPSMTMSGGVLKSTPDLTIVNSPFNWSGGSVDGPGALILPATTNLTGFVNRYAKPITVPAGATLNASVAGTTLRGSGGTITNNGTIDMSGDGTQFSDFVNPGTIDNYGVLKKSGVNSSALLYAITNRSTGTVTALNNVMLLSAGGTGGGTWSAAASATLGFNGGTFTLDPTSVVNGSGTIQFAGNPVVTIAGSYAPVATRVYGSNVTLAGSTMDTGLTWVYANGNLFLDGAGSASISQLAVTGGTLGGTATASISAAPFTWTGGTLSGSGALTLPAGTNISGTVTLDGKPIVNGGSVSIGAGTSLTGANGAVVTNNGTIDIADGATLNVAAGTATIDNFGLLRKADFTAVSTINFAVNNDLSGTIEVDDGTLAFGSPIAMGGTLYFPLTSATTFGKIGVTGAQTLGGTLTVAPVGGYTPNAGQVFPILNYGGYSGAFTTKNLTFAGGTRSFTENYQPTNLTLTASAPPCATPAATIVSWWRAEGNANDAIGANNGALNYGATTAAGTVGQAFSFDGSTGYVSVPDDPSLHVSTFTAVAWVKFNTNPSKATILEKPDAVGGQSLRIWYDSGVLYAASGSGSASNPFTPVAGSWYLIAETFDGSNLVLYVNDVVLASASGIASPPYDSSPLTIGAGVNGTANYFPGLIDEVILFNAPLTAADILAIYDAGSSGVCYTAPPAPTISAIVPAAGPIGGGQSVTINGNNLSNVSSALFGGAPASISSRTATALTVSTPAHAAGAVDVAVTNPGGTTTQTGGYLYVAQPTITGFTPTSGAVGTAVTLNGTNFDPGTGVKFNATAATATYVNSTQINTNVPAGATTGPITVFNAGGNAVSSTNFTVIPPAPTISVFSPIVGAPGTTVVLTGSAFTGATAVFFNGKSAPSFSVDSDTQITVRVPLGATTGYLSVTTPYGTGTSASTFAMLAPSCTAAPSGIVSWYRMHDTAVDSVGVNNGAFFGGMTYVPGEVGQSMKFDGSSGYFAATDADASLHTADVTLEGWFRFDAVTTAMLVSKSVGIGTYASYILYYDSGALRGVVGDASGLGTELQYPFTPATATWYHIAYTFDHNTLMQALYVNGIQVEAGSGSKPIGYDSHPLMIGAEYRNEIVQFFSPISADEVAVYGRALAPAEVENIYYAGYAGKCITLTPPTVSGFTPSSGAAGSSVAINGTGFIGTSSVAFNGMPAASFTVLSATQITATVPTGALSGLISVTTAGGTASSTSSFTVLQPPNITSFAPASGTVGTVVTIAGSGFTGTTAVTFNGVASTFTVVGDTAIDAAVPTGATTGAITVVNPAGTVSTTASFTVIAAPKITGLSPTSGAVGWLVTITGSGFTGASAVSFSGTAASHTVNSDTQITATVPAGAKSGPVTVTTPGGTATSPGNFTVIQPPAITSFAPMSGPVGTTVTINGSSFTGASAVSFNTTAATFTVNNDTQITATVPTGATSGAIYVTAPTGTATSAATFTVTQPPSVTSFSPASGSPGTVVIVTGSGFTGATAVTFHTTPAITFTVDSDTQITATVPAGATSGPISITTPFGTASSTTSFTVIVVTAGPLTATVSASGPTTFCNGGSVTLVASGSGGSGTYTGYQWYANGAPINGATAATYVAKTSGSFSATVTDSSKAVSPLAAAVVVTINPAPVATVSAPATVVAGSLGNTASVLAAGAGATYAWTISGGSITAGQGTPSITWSAGVVSGTVVIGVTVTTGASCPANGSVTIPVSGAADLSIAISAPTSVNTGDAIAYVLTVSNAGPSAAQNVSVTDTLPSGVIATSASGFGWNCLPAGNLVACTASSVVVGNATPITINVTAPATAGALTDTTTVAASTADPNGGNNSASATTQVVVPAPLCDSPAPALVKPDDGATALQNPITFTWLAVANAAAYDVWINGSVATTVTGTSATLSLPAGPATWSVAARFATNGCPPVMSATRSFTVAPAANCDHGAPQLIAPPLNATVPSPVEFQWTAVPEAVNYRVWVAIDNGAPQDIGLSNGAIHFMAPLTGTNVTWFVEALFNGCTSTKSASSAFALPKSDPCANHGTASLTAPADQSTTSMSSIQFQWTGVANANGYRVWAKVGNGESTALGTTNSDTTLTANISSGAVEWYVQTLFDGCAGTESAHFTFTIPPAQQCPTTAPAIIGPTTGAALTANSVQFSWTAAPGAIGYEVWLALSGSTPSLLGTTTSTSFTHDVAAGALEWFVRANVNGCASLDSAHATFSVTPPAACGQLHPILTKPADNEHVVSPVSFAWSAVAQATQYKVWLQRPTAPPQLLGTTAATHLDAQTLQNGAWTWSVEAIFGNGCGSTQSAEGSFVVVPPTPACAAPTIPVPRADSQVSANIDYVIAWTAIGNAAFYEYEESTSSDFVGATPTSTYADHVVFNHANATTAAVAYFYRVRMVSQCDGARSLFSPAVAVVILPPHVTTPTHADGATPADDPQTVTYTLIVGGNTPGAIPGQPGQSFSAVTNQPWITVTPASGTVTADGVTLTVTANTSGLPVGTSTGSVTILFGTAAGKYGVTGGSSSTTTVNVNLVQPTTPTTKNAPPPDALIIPAVAHAAGMNSRFQSDVRVTNTAPSVRKFQVTFTPTGETGSSSGKQAVVSIDPGATLALDDVLTSWFGAGALAQGAIGTLEIRPMSTSSVSSPTSTSASGVPSITTFAASRTYNTTANGTFGQYIPAIPFSQFIGSGNSCVTLQQIAHSEAYRTNVGLVEGAAEPATVLLRVFGKDGAKLGEFTQSLNPGQHIQLNGLLGAHNLSTDNGRIEVRVTSTTGKVTAYASVVDNITNDPYLVSPVQVTALGAKKWVIPGVADLNNGLANWQSDVRLFNAGTSSVKATLTFVPQDSNAPSIVKTLDVAPGEVKQLDDILPSIFGIHDNGGALHITTDNSAPLVASACTYNETSHGTYGQFTPAVTPNEAVGRGQRALQILEVEESDRYRSNIGIAEVTGNAATVEITAIPPDSKTAVTTQIAVKPNEYRQYGSLLRSLGLGDTYNARITVRVIDGDGKVTAYASVIDQKTQDPTYVPAQ